MAERIQGSMPRRFPTLLSRALSTAGLLACALLASGCTPKNPIMRVNAAEIRGGQVGVSVGSLFPIPMPKVSVDALMRVYVAGENQNSFDIQIRGVRGQVMMMNRYTIPISTPLGAWLQADSTTPFSFDVTVPVATGLAILRESSMMGCIPYTLQGSADVTATSTFKLERDNYPISQSGCIPRAAMMAAFPGG